MAGSSMVFSLIGKDISASKAIQGVGKSAEKVGGGLSSALGNGVKVAGLAVASAAVVVGAGAAAALVKGFGDATAYQTLQKKTAAVLKATGDKAGTSVEGVKQLASTLEDLSGVDENLIVNSQNVMLTFRNVRNEAGKGNDIFTKATKAALNMSSALGTDLQGSTMALGKALNDPIKGMTRLSRVGVSFTDAQVKQVKAMVKAGDTMGAQKVILRELNKEFGGAAKAAGSGFAGAMARLSDAFNDTMRDIATALLPAATKFVNWIRASALPWLRELVKWVGANLGPAMAKLGAWVGTVLVPALQQAGRWIMSTLVPAIVQLYQMMAKNLQPAVESLSQFWHDSLQPALRDSWPTILNIAKALAVTTGAIMVAESWIIGKLVPALTQWWRFLIIVGTAIAKVIGVLIDWGTRSFRTVQQVVAGAQRVAGAFSGLLSGVKIAWGGIRATIGAVVSWFGQSVWPRIRTVVRLMSGVWSGVSSAARAAFNLIASAWNNTVGRISFTIPDWVPGLGGKGFSAPKIPMMAAGGIVTRPMLAVIGEAGPEAVVPLSRHTSGVNINVHVSGAVDPVSSGRQLVKILNSYQRTTGVKFNFA